MMKKTILFLSTIIIGLTILVSCSDDNDKIEDIKALKLAKKEISVFVGEKVTVKVTSGNGSYVVKPSNTRVKASATKEILTVEGVSTGNSIVTITDSKNKIETINVVVVAKTSPVSDLKFDKSELNLKKGTKGLIKVTAGSGSYTVLSNDKTIATVTNSGATIEVTAVEKGATEIVVTDTKSKKTAKISVNVTDDKLILDVTSVELKKGSKKTVKIIEGSGEYLVVSKDNTIASVVKTGTNLEISGLKKGVTKIIVTDTKFNLKKEIIITVNVDVLKLNKISLSLKKGLKGIITITSGSGNYTVVSKDNTTATVTNTGASIEVTAVKAGSTEVVVTDTESNLTKQISVEVVEQKEFAFSLMKNGEPLPSYKTDKDGPYYNVSVGDLITIKITGGTGTDQKVVEISAGTSYLEFLDTKKDIIQNNSLEIEVKSVATTPDIYFRIKDSDGKLSQYITFTVK